MHGMSTDKFPNMFFIGGNTQTASAVNAVHLLDEQSQYVAHIIAQTDAKNARAVEAEPEHVEQWVRIITESPKNHAMFRFFAQCTPGYYNAESKAESSADLFIGGRYGDGPLAYYNVLHNWAGRRATTGVRAQAGVKFAEFGRGRRADTVLATVRGNGVADATVCGSPFTGLSSVERLSR